MFTTIVTAIDFSDMSRDVLHYAARLAASAPAARILAVHAVPDPLERPWTMEGVAFDYTELEKIWRADAIQRLEALSAAEGLSAEVCTPMVLRGSAADAITAFAAQRAADVIVMGTHGYGPVKHLVLGSVAERVLRRATCPVLTIPYKSLEPQTTRTEEETARQPDAPTTAA